MSPQARNVLDGLQIIAAVALLLPAILADGASSAQIIGFGALIAIVGVLMFLADQDEPSPDGAGNASGR